MSPNFDGFSVFPLVGIADTWKACAELIHRWTNTFEDRLSTRAFEFVGQIQQKVQTCVHPPLTVSTLSSFFVPPNSIELNPQSKYGWINEFEFYFISNVWWEETRYCPVCGVRYRLWCPRSFNLFAPHYYCLSTTKASPNCSLSSPFGTSKYKRIASTSCVSHPLAHASNGTYHKRHMQINRIVYVCARFRVSVCVCVRVQREDNGRVDESARRNTQCSIFVRSARERESSKTLHRTNFLRSICSQTNRTACIWARARVYLFLCDSAVW